MIRIPANQVADRVERAGGAEVVLLRDRLVPLVYLAEALGSPRTERGAKALNVVLVDSATFEYGLVVEDLHDTVEIVVKPMGRHLQGLRVYAGATILGDGQVAVILDVSGLSQRAGLSRATAVSLNAEASPENAGGEMHSLLLFQNGPGEHCAVPIELVTRIERVRAAQVENLGGRRTMQYGGVSLPLVALHDAAAVGRLDETQQWVVVVFDCAGRTVSLLAAEPLDMIETRLEMDTATFRQPGLAGSALLNGRTTLMVDIFELADTVRGRWPETKAAASAQAVLSKSESAGTILVAEDSDFFRGQIKRIIEAVGYKVLTAEDGQSAWELLDSHANEISLVTTDVEMPRLDGLGLTKRIRADARFAHLHVIALSTLACDEEMARGLAIGVSEYGEIAHADCAYLAPGGRQMKVGPGKNGEIVIRIADDPPENACRPSVDYLFRSVALHFPGRSIAAILTGMRNDGTEGVRMLKRGGSVNIAQDEASCVVFAMPREAIVAGVVDSVVPLSQIAGTIVRAVSEARA